AEPPHADPLRGRLEPSRPRLAAALRRLVRGADPPGGGGTGATRPGLADRGPESTAPPDRRLEALTGDRRARLGVGDRSLDGPLAAVCRTPGAPGFLGLSRPEREPPGLLPGPSTRIGFRATPAPSGTERSRGDDRDPGLP